jgi:phage/plasmid-like protein (TIGR03299 family)
MAHEIETHGRQAAAVFAREDAWHRLGTTLEDVFTAEEAMTIGHLGGWNVRETPLQGIDLDENGANLVDVPDRFATVGTSYAVIQNEEHADTLNQLVEDSGAIFDTAGSLCGGRQVFVSLRLPETMRVGDTDEIRTNIVALNGHDGTQAFRLLVTPVRVVRANTQAAAIAYHTASVSIRHTTNASIQVARIRDALGLSFRYIEAFETEAEKMIQQT